MKKSFAISESVNVDLVLDVGEVDLATEPGCTAASVEIRGDEEYIEAFDVRFSGSTLTVHAPQRDAGPGVRFNLKRGSSQASRGPRVHIAVTVPDGSALVLTNAAADIAARGVWATISATSGSGKLRFEEANAAVVDSGSGDVSLDAVHGDANVHARSGAVALGRVDGSLTCSTGSGDVTLGDTILRHAMIQTGSGEVRLREIGGALTVRTGSGDIRAQHVGDKATVQTASGDIRLGRLDGDAQVSTASGDVDLGRIAPGEYSVRSASGDLRVAVAPRVPVWTDVRSLSGALDNRIVPVGEPEQGEPTIRLHSQTISGDIELRTAAE